MSLISLVVTLIVIGVLFLFLGSAPAALLAGYLAYQRKEGVSRPAPMAAPLQALWPWLLLPMMAPAMPPSSVPVAA